MDKKTAIDIFEIVLCTLACPLVIPALLKTSKEIEGKTDKD